VILSFQVTFLFAGTDEKINLNSNDFVTAAISSLAPTTPAVADFSDVIPEPVASTVSLAPVTPKEADFNDEVPENLNDLAPVAPAEADFDEMLTDQVDFTLLAPTAPTYADFE
jgi:hypothetical protein